MNEEESAPKPAGPNPASQRVQCIPALHLEFFLPTTVISPLQVKMSGRSLLEDVEHKYNYSEARDLQLTSWSIDNGISVGICFVLLALFGYGGLYLTGRISANVMEQMSKGVEFKSLVTTVLANSGLVSAVVLSIVIAQMSISSPTEPPTTAWNVYVGTCFLSAGFAVQGVVTSAMGVIFCYPLSENENKRMFLKYPQNLGFPISSMVICAMLLIFQSVMYVSIVCNTMMPIYTSVAGFICAYNIVTNFLDLSCYKSSEISESDRLARRTYLGRDRNVATWANAVISHIDGEEDEYDSHVAAAANLFGVPLPARAENNTRKSESANISEVVPFQKVLQQDTSKNLGMDDE